jgi:hypothetical protein
MMMIDMKQENMPLLPPPRKMPDRDPDTLDQKERTVR